MRWSKTLIPTMKEIPADAEVPSHQLMLRAGLIRQLMAGSYTYLPLGWKALRKAEAIVREEMEAAGAIEIHMPALQPIDLFVRTGRREAFGNACSTGSNAEATASRTSPSARPTKRSSPISSRSTSAAIANCR